MKRFLYITLLLVWLTGCAAGGSGTGELSGIFQAYPELKGRAYTTETVKRVVDGDTFELQTGEKVRLIGINTPETVKPNSPVEQYGKEASAYTKSKLTGKTVILFSDAGDKDKYGRLLRYAFVKGEADMYNMTLIKEGYANTMTIPPNVMFSKQFVEAERQARKAKKGLWREGSGTTASAAASGAPCKDPKIKGNINSKNEKIYHIPGGSSYEQTKAELLFCTEADAEAAGFRKAAR